ncbi:TPA: hypothetical protein ACH3X1_000757 [Trebouxia sp. C0004]
MALTGLSARQGFSLHYKCAQQMVVPSARLASGRRYNVRQQKRTIRHRCDPCCDARPGASEPGRDPSLPPNVPRAKPAPSWNPFKNTKKEDAARAALQDMFKDKGDLLAVYDDAPGGGSGGKGKGKGGGGGSGGGKGGGGFRFDPSDYWRRFLRLSKGLFSTLGAVLLFGVAISAVSLWKPLLGGIAAFFRYILRLDGPGVRRGQQSSQPQLVDSASDLGAAEQSVIGKYGGDDYFAPDSDEDEAL